MIGTKVLFDVKVFNNDGPSRSDWERKTGTIRDKIRKPYEDKFIGRNMDVVIDYYVIESNGKYYFIQCDQILFN